MQNVTDYYRAETAYRREQIAREFRPVRNRRWTRTRSTADAA